MGKSKSAQYGQVDIESIEAPTVFQHAPCNQSSISYLPGKQPLPILMSTAKLHPKILDWKEKEKINQAASQIRTYSYSPWNAHRNTTDPQRDCILKGSTIIF